MKRPSDTRRVGCRALLVLAALFLAVGCQAPQDGTGGETHFLKKCQAGSCGGGLACLCGVCTRACTGPADCEVLPGGECVPAPASCAGAPPPALCDADCTTDADCSRISSDHRCEGGWCRAEPSGASAAGGAGGAGACTSGEVDANQVVVLGDSFFGATHQITAYLEDRARTASALAVGERYRDLSSILNNALALGGNGIASQYAEAAAEAPVEVVIMNGGGADILAGSCATLTSDCQVLVDASVAAEDLLSQMATDGVAHVVYAFYPDPVDPDLMAEMDALRPLIEAVCQASPAPCHWLDLRPTFAGRYEEYVQPDGRNPTAAGAEASAAAIWATMQANCIAQ